MLDGCRLFRRFTLRVVGVTPCECRRFSALMRRRAMRYAMR